MKTNSFSSCFSSQDCTKEATQNREVDEEKKSDEEDEEEEKTKKKVSVVPAR